MKKNNKIILNTLLRLLLLIMLVVNKMKEINKNKNNKMKK